MARILVAGSISVDEVINLRGPLLRGTHLEGSASGRRLGGGAANTALPLAFAGHAVTLLSAAGTGPEGDWLIGELGEAGIETLEIERIDGPSTRSLIFVEPDGERTVVNVHRCRGSVSEKLGTLPAGAVYVRGRELQVASLLRQRLSTSLVVCHVPPVVPGSRPAHVLVASESDFEKTELADPWEMGSAIAGGSLRWIVLTRGAAGAVAYSREKRIEVPARAARTVDSTAAGDVFAAGLIHALITARLVPNPSEPSPVFGPAEALDHASMERALRAANAWGAAAVEAPGLPDRATIARLSTES